MGDRNTKFFHACANQRKKKNQIFKIQDAQGATWESPEEIKVAFVDYFANLFTAGGGSNMDQCLQNINTKVTDEMNNELLKDFSCEEVTFALKQMGPLKALRPDGFPARFFLNH